MKNCKRILLMLLACVMLLTVFVGCGGNTVPADAGWEIGKDEHWHLTEGGEKADAAAHTLEGSMCTVCGAEIIEFDDGEIWVQVYNDHADMTLWMIYDAEGALVSSEKSEYTYDEQGNWATEKVYTNGVLSEEKVYNTVYEEDGHYTEVKEITSYNDDGTKALTEYNENADPAKETGYDADGNVIYVYDIVVEYNECGMYDSMKKYDGDTVVWETAYEYNENYDMLAERTYHNSVIVEEDIYAFDADGFNYLWKEVRYNEDGAQSVVEYDAYGEVIG